MGRSLPVVTTGFPHRRRLAFTTELSGFHSATGRTHPGIPAIPRNAVDKNVNSTSTSAPAD